MSLPVFISDTDAAVGQLAIVSGSEARHAITVKRLKPGEELSLIDTEGTVRRCVMVAVTAKDSMEVKVISVEVVPPPNPTVTVVQAIPKAERSELAIDLLTQGGADQIVAWQAQRCIANWSGKAEKSLKKWRSAAQAAAKQARRATIPEISGVAGLSDVEKLVWEADLAIVLHEEAQSSIRDHQFSGKVVVIIGPEGGISPTELTNLTAAGAHSVRLGREVLRTATAGLVALSAIGVLSQRW